MNLNALIQPTRKPVTDLVADLQKKNYFVDKSFQRKLVWTEKQKIRLIETILMNYPIPEIYIWDQGADPDSGAQTHSIVDGQQRLTTLNQFVANEFPLKANYLDDENKTENYADKFWKDLNPDDKKIIWEYLFNVRVIPASITEQEIRAIFMRLNETDKSLNPQELRHAEFNGSFITAAEEISNFPFWHKWNIFTDSQIRRMGDIDFASSLLIFLRQGITTDTAQSINDIYDTYNDIYEERQNDIEKVKNFLDFFDMQLERFPALRSLFTKPNNIYTVFAIDDMHRDRGNLLRNNIDKLVSFVSSYEEGRGKIIADYKEGVSSRTRSKTSREKRIFSLENWLKGNEDGEDFSLFPEVKQTLPPIIQS